MLRLCEKSGETHTLPPLTTTQGSRAGNAGDATAYVETPGRPTTTSKDGEIPHSYRRPVLVVRWFTKHCLGCTLAAHSRTELAGQYRAASLELTDSLRLTSYIDAQMHRRWTLDPRSRCRHYPSRGGSSVIVAVVAVCCSSCCCCLLRPQPPRAVIRLPTHYCSDDGT